MESSQCDYTAVVRVLCEHFEVSDLLCRCVALPKQSTLAAVLTRLYEQTGQILPFIDFLVRDSLKTADKDSTTFLRGNVLATKVENFYAKPLVQDFLNAAWGDLIRELVADKELDLEISEAYAQSTISEETLNKNKELLVSYSQRFVDALTRPELLDKIPRGVRAIANSTLRAAEAAHLDAPAKFVGGFLVLRLLVPALLSPDTSHLIPEGTELTELNRRNLVLISKVIQVLSNMTTSPKEESMKALKEFLDANFGKMETFLLEVTRDPLNKEQPFADLFGVKPKEDATVDKDTLTELHKFLFENLPAFKEAKSSQIIQPDEAFDKLIEEVEKLGDPPDASLLTTVTNTVLASGKAAVDIGWSFATTAASFVSNFFFGTEDEATQSETNTETK